MDDEPIGLSTTELFVLAALVRVTIEVDGRIDVGEVRAVSHLHELVAEREGVEEGGAYRTAPARSSLDRARWSAIWDEAAARYPSRTAALAAANQVRRREACEAIYALVREVAAADTIDGGEWPWLEELAAAWSIDVRR